MLSPLYALGRGLSPASLPACHALFFHLFTFSLFHFFTFSLFHFFTLRIAPPPLSLEV